MLCRHLQVKTAAPQRLGEGDPYPMYPGGLGGDAPVTAEGGGGAIGPKVLDCPRGDSQRHGEAPRLQLACPFSGPGAGGPHHDPGGDGRQDPRGVRHPRALAQGVPVRRGLHRSIRGQEDLSGLVRPYTRVSTGAGCAVAAGRTCTSRWVSAMVWSRRS